jgi:hypothetical protein
MDPRGKARLCAQCDTLVHDLSSMRESEARRFLAKEPRSLCVRYLFDANGNIWFSDSKLVPPASLVRGKRLAGTLLLAAALSTPVLTEACGGASPYDDVYVRNADAGEDADADAERAPADAQVGEGGAADAGDGGG